MFWFSSLLKANSFVVLFFYTPISWVDKKDAPAGARLFYPNRVF
jgi:hypothetical protein